MAYWSEIEVDLIIEDYFQMLHMELRGNKVNKAAHRRKLLSQLNNRDGGVEYKHQNISAVLIKYGLPYVNGYKPRWHYQKLLEEKVIAYVARNAKLESDFNDFANQKVQSKPNIIQYENWIESPPMASIVQEPLSNYYTPVKRNYLELEQRNQSVGLTGEEMAFEYEKWRLGNAGYPKLAKEVKWVSRDQGDGAGYDILSKKPNGSDIFIEVKTTTLGKDTPIFFSKTENDFSNDYRDAFHLYRVFDVKKKPRMFTRSGSFKDMCTIEAVNFKGIF